jgi:hypothetical protein
MKVLYTCGVKWQHEIGEAGDIEGRMPFYSSIEELKEKCGCWAECGIVEINLEEVRWVEPQGLFEKSEPNGIN